MWGLGIGVKGCEGLNCEVWKGKGTRVRGIKVNNVRDRGVWNG